MNLLSASKFNCDALIVLISSAKTETNDALSIIIRHVRKSNEIELLEDQCILIFDPDGIAAKRLILVSLKTGDPKYIRYGISSAISKLKGIRLEKIGICFESTPVTANLSEAIYSIFDSTYVYAKTKTKVEGRLLNHVTLGLPNAIGFKKIFNQSLATSNGVEFAKEWANRPANYATPSMLAKAASILGGLPKFNCQVLSYKDVSKLGMGAFMAVSQGSEEPLKFIVLKYNGAPKNKPPVVLIGKGITFDSGGISIKSAAEMDEMKFDMSGAASVLGVFKALGELKPDINVVGLIPACENLINGRAVKPGDVVTSMSGQTIEVLNTDAEGRLVLCDALTYAERYQPSVVIDIATLTGACVVALGSVRTGMFSNNDSLADDLITSAEEARDLCWRMPLDDAYADGLKTNFADVANVAGRSGGAVTAAKFLERFCSSFKWAHLDIAGTAWKSGANKGATGRPVPMLIQYILKKSEEK